MADIGARFKLYGKTAAAWTSANPTPLARELCVETDTGKAKLGDGTTAWTSLPYWNAGGVSSFNTRTGAVTLSYADVTGALAFTPVSAAGAVSAVAGAATGILKSSGSALAAAVAATDFVAPGAVTTSGLTMATARLLGRTTASTGAVQEISVGSGLAMASGTLSWPGHPGYAAGGYYLADGIGVPATPAANASNTIYFHPFLLLADTTVDSLLARVTTGAASGLFQMALYAADATTRLPTGAALYSSASQSTTSAATIEDTGPSLALKAGLYWTASNKDTTAATAVFLSTSVSQFRVAQTVPAQTAAGLLAGTATSLTGYSRTSSTFGTWPTLTGVYATDGLAQVTSTLIPVIGFKAA